MSQKTAVETKLLSLQHRLKELGDNNRRLDEKIIAVRATRAQVNFTFTHTLLI
jgi:hypothetical protein